MLHAHEGNPCGWGTHVQPREGQGRPVLGNPCVGNTLQWLLSFHTYGVMRAGIAFFHPCCRFSMRMEQIARRRRTVRARWLFLHTHGAHPYHTPVRLRGAQFFSMRMEHIAKSLPGPIRAPLSLHIQSHSKRSLLGCAVVLHIII